MGSRAARCSPGHQPELSGRTLARKDRAALTGGSHSRPGPGGYQPRQVPGLRRAGRCRPALLAAHLEVRRLRFPRLAVPVVAIAAMVTAGCSSGGGLTAGQAHHDSAPARPGTSAAPPTGSQLGEFLKHLKLPAGWSHANGAGGGEVDSGGTARPGPGPSQVICSRLDSSAYASTFIGWWAESYASQVVTYPPEAQNLPEVTLTLGVFRPGYAARTMALVSSLAGRCRSFVDHYPPHDPDTVSATAVPHLGDQNLYLTSVERTKDGNITDQVLLTRVGNDIAGVDSNDAGGGAVRPATVKGFAGWLAGLLPKLPTGSSTGGQNQGAPPSVAPPG